MEEQTSANTEKLEPAPNEEAVANDASDAEASKKNGRTLKLKASEAEASTETETDTPAEPTAASDEEAPQGHRGQRSQSNYKIY